MEKRWVHCFGSLNEGRGRNPDETGVWATELTAICDPQRRPGSQPRRDRWRGNLWTFGRTTLNEGRGRNPDETWSKPKRTYSYPALNEGRGRNPDETARTWIVPTPCELPSTKAGVATPTRRGIGTRSDRGAMALNEGRGRNPDETTYYWCLFRQCLSLNEGRGRNPDETRLVSR